MQILPSTLLALIAIGVFLAQGPRRGLWAFFLIAPFGAAAAFNLPALGGASIGLKDMAIVTGFGLLILSADGAARFAGTLRPFAPGFVLLVLWAYCAFSAIFAPALFSGATEVFSLSRSANDSGIVSIPLRPGTGNITQLFTLTIAALGFATFATLLRMTPDARLVLRGMALATVVHFVLGWLDVLTFSTGLQILMEPIRTANYAILVDHAMAGMKRMIGGFPEASAFGAFSLALFAFWLHVWVVGPRTRYTGALLAISLLLLLRSTSSGAYVALAVYLVSYGAYHLLVGLRPDVSRRGASIFLVGLGVVWFSLVGLGVAYQLSEGLQAFLDRALFTKLETQSGVERMSWNTQAFRNFTDTLGVGAGLGSVRASSWLFASLGSIGVIGTGLFLVFLGLVMLQPARTGDSLRDATVGGLKALCLALWLNALLTGSTPNLGAFFFVMAGLCVGLSRGGVLQSRGAAG